MFTETGGHPVNESQSEGRTETIISNIFKSGESNVRIRTCSLAGDAYATTYGVS